MTDDRIALALRPLREPARPDPAFTEQLWEALMEEVDFTRGTARHSAPRGLFGWLRAAPQARRWFLLLSIVALLAALLASLAIIGNRPQQPVSILERSRQFYVDPKPFDLTLPIVDVLNGNTPNHLTLRYRYNGAGLIRGDVLASDQSALPAGAHFIFDGHTYYEFNVDGSYQQAFSAVSANQERGGLSLFTYSVAIAGDRSWPLQILPLTWDRGTTFASPAPQDPCTTPNLVARETVLDRPADHVSCDDGQRDYWIDTETGFILRLRTQTQDWVPTAIDLHPSFAADVFDLPRGPNGEVPINSGQIEPGRYFTTVFKPTLVLALGDGWSDATDNAATFSISRRLVVTVGVMQPGSLIDPGTGKDVAFSGTAADLLAWLRRHPALQVGPVTSVTIGGRPAIAFELAVRTGAPTVPCVGAPSSGCIPVLDLRGGGRNQLTAGLPERWVLLETGVTTLLVDISGSTAADRAEALNAFQEAVTFP